MSGFEFTPFGVLPIGAYKPELEEGIITGAHAAPVEQLPLAGVAAPLRGRPQAPGVPPVRPEAIRLRPVDVVKMARARLRDVKRDIARLKKLEAERDELERLIAAADNKPRAVVRSLPTRSA